VTGSCSCLGDEHTGKTRTCLVSNEAGTCYGQETCDGQVGWQGCTAKTPTTEVCDGVDNDCNLLTDDVPGRGNTCAISNAAGSCPGVLDCAAGSTELTCVGKTPAAETCNYLDDDCDGQTDEGFAGLFGSCSAGQGLCQRFGFVECTPDGSGTQCNAVAAPAGVEVCDGL